MCILRMFMAICSFVLISSVANAAVQWYPDYLEINYTGRVTTGTGKPISTVQKTCEDYGYHSAPLAGTTCTKYFPGDDLTCYKDCKCTSEYN